MYKDADKIKAARNVPAAFICYKPKLFVFTKPGFSLP